MTVKELRATATAALQAWQSAQHDPTIPKTELKRLKRTADEAHDRLVNAIADKLGGVHAVPGE